MIDDKDSYPSLRTYPEKTSILTDGRIWPQDTFEAHGTLGVEKVQGLEILVHLANMSTQDLRDPLERGDGALLNPSVGAQHRARAGVGEVVVSGGPGPWPYPAGAYLPSEASWRLRWSPEALVPC